MKVLIVDDSKTSRVVITTFLQKLGHEVLSANNGAEGLDVLHKNKNIDVIFLDWHMPEVDAPMFLSLLKTENLVGPAIVILSAEKDLKKIQELVDKWNHVGLVDFVSKPYTKEIIEEKLKKATLIE
ncbi:MAG: response regulator [Oligoflexia bacterium]|nr:response regulator [Oligoflexia bacterium]